MDFAKILRLKSSPCRGQVWVNRVKDLGSEPQLAREKQHLPRIAYTVYLKKIEKSMETKPSGSWDPHTGPVNKCSSSFYLITKAKFSFYKYYIKWKLFLLHFIYLLGKAHVEIRENLQKLVLSFCPVHWREQAQAVRLGSKYLYSLGHPSSHREMKVLSFTVILHSFLKLT